MREIKFRVWNKKTEKMSDSFTLNDALTWSTGSYIGNHEGHKPLEERHIAMQYTGLKDKNGIEIYEGDIIRVYETERGCYCKKWDEEDSDEMCVECAHLCDQEVKWKCGYFTEEDIGDFCPPLNSDDIQIEVIGNIYQNPELIK